MKLISNIHDAADALANKLKSDFVDSSNDTLLKAQFIKQINLFPNECVVMYGHEIIRAILA